MKRKLVKFDITQALNNMRRIVLTWFKETDFTIYLRIDYRTGIERLRNRQGKKRKSSLNIEDDYIFRESIRMYDFLSDFFQDRYIVINGTKSIKEIADEVWRKLFPSIKNKFTSFPKTVT